MRILIFHGYLLHGTGSNVYNARLAEALVRAGHEVHLLCQDRDPFSLGWVDAVGHWDGGALTVEARRDEVRGTVYRPDIGDLLPVYVADRYEGVQARPFPELSDEEVEAYVERNVAAVRAVVEAARPDVALANHLVMGPAVLARALAGTGVPYAVKIHGSALEYTVKPHPRFGRWAREGLAGASGVLVGSRHTGESLWAAMDDPVLPDRTRLGPPGVDVVAFAPRDAEAAREGLRALVEDLGGTPGVLEDVVQAAGGHGGAAPGGSAGAPPADAAPASGLAGAGAPPAEAAPASGFAGAGAPPADAAPPSAPAGAGAPPADAAPASAFARAEGEAGRALAHVDPDADRLVVFVGKLIASKGLELLLAAFPLVLREQPDARLVVVGFGAFREGLERLAALLAAGDLDGARALRAEDGRELPELAAFVDGLGADRDGYLEAAARIPERVVWTGRLDHAELEDLLPAAEALVAPSTFPEAFGMVAAEGAACAALPVVARHSGLAEVSEALAERVPEAARAWLSFAVGPDAVRDLGACLTGWLGAPEDVRAATREAIVAVTRERWSWDGVARTVIAAAQGRLDDLPRP